MSNELKLIEEAKNNSLLELLSGLPYVLWDVMVVRKQGTGLVVEADPFDSLVAVTPLDDQLNLLADACKNYEDLVGSFDPTTGGKTDQITAACQAIKAYNLKNHLLVLDIEYTDHGLKVDLSAEAFSISPFSWANDKEVLTSVGSYAGTRLLNGGVSLSGKR